MLIKGYEREMIWLLYSSDVSHIVFSQKDTAPHMLQKCKCCV